MNKSPQEIVQFLNTAQDWMQRNPKESKFRYALSKVAKSTGKLWGAYQERSEEIRIDNCATDDKGVILRDEKGGYRFTKDGLKACNKEINALFKSSVEIEPYYATELPHEDDLTADERDVFEGFVIREQGEPVPELVNGKAEHQELTQ